MPAGQPGPDQRQDAPGHHEDRGNRGRIQTDRPPGHPATSAVQPAGGIGYPGRWRVAVTRRAPGRSSGDLPAQHLGAAGGQQRLGCGLPTGHQADLVQGLGDKLIQAIQGG